MMDGWSSKNVVHPALQTAPAAAPPGMQLTELFDQSEFVKQSR
jgi:multidrug efflux pump subunit AcrB